MSGTDLAYMADAMPGTESRTMRHVSTECARCPVLSSRMADHRRDELMRLFALLRRCDVT
eukprot:1712134-Rhodomonas_salina.1